MMSVKKLTQRDKKRLFRLVLVIVVALAGYFSQQPQPPAEVLGTVAPGYYRVASFEDGDTITIEMDGKEERIRMIGVDTPETKDPRKPVQCFGQAASAFTKNLVGDQPVRLQADPLSSNRDRYDRLLRHVYLPDGRMVQAEIIKQGYGFAYVSFPFTKADEFKKLETEAREDKRGLWNDCDPEINQYGGYTSNPE